MSVGELRDSHHRVIRDLRLSITDRCNYRCTYCMDPDFRYMPKKELLSLEEYLTLARVCVSLGVEKIRITGGEPTMYPQLNQVIETLGQSSFPYSQNVLENLFSTDDSRSVVSCQL